MADPRNGIDIAAADAPDHAAVVRAFNAQLLIVFLKRLGGKVSIPVAEIDETGSDLLAFRIDKHKVFHFEIRKKQ